MFKFHQVACVQSDIEGALMHMIKSGKEEVEEDKSSSFWLRLESEINNNLFSKTKPVRKLFYCFTVQVVPVSVSAL
jgi:hypothetical protein